MSDLRKQTIAQIAALCRAINRPVPNEKPQLFSNYFGDDSPLDAITTSVIRAEIIKLEALLSALK